jgi:putative nucleotidyltransferase with HDIG domain/PAS domain S-box-containing protein
MGFKYLHVGLKIPLLYLIFGGLWILLSDRFLAALFQDPDKLTEFQSYKGWMFVAASALFIYFLLKRYLDFQRQAALRIRTSEERLQLALTAGNQGIFDLDVESGVIEVNEIIPKMLGINPDNFRETIDSWVERIHPEDREIAGRQISNLLRGELIELVTEYRIITQSGELLWIYLRGSIVERFSNGSVKRVSGVLSNITEKKNSELRMARLFEESNTRLHRIEALHEIDQAISTNFHQIETLQSILKHLKNELAIDAAAILLADGTAQMYSHNASIGFMTSTHESTHFNIGESYSQKSIQKDCMISLEVDEVRKIDASFADMVAREGFKSYISFPLFAKGKLKGLLEIFHRSSFSPDREWINFAKTLAGQTAIAIENAHLFDSLNEANTNLIKINQDLLAAYDATIESLSRAIDMRDKETENHSLRVMKITMEFATKLGFNEIELNHIRRGALLHDIGKLAVPDSILNKNGFLDEDERKIIQEHPVFAFNMLKTINYLLPAIDIPHLHHEKWDGSGYPNGLKGEEIPKAARMFAIVDVFEALTSDRPYRKAWSIDQAIQYIIEQKSKHFDPDLVDKFVEFSIDNPIILINERN